jgi:hypothetical protein
MIGMKIGGIKILFPIIILNPKVDDSIPPKDEQHA